MHVSTATLTRAARDQGYAVPAVNVFDEVSMRAVVGRGRRRTLMARPFEYSKIGFRGDAIRLRFDYQL